MSDPKNPASAGMPGSLVHPEALNEVFDVVDVNGDGVLTVHQFIMVRALERCFVSFPHGHLRANSVDFLEGS